MHLYERWILQRYLANVLRSKSRDGRNSNTAFLKRLHARRAGRASFPVMKFNDDVEIFSNEASGDEDKRTWPPARLRQWRSAIIAAARAPAPDVSPLQARLDWLGEACSLDATQRFLLGLVARITRSADVEKLVATVNSHDYRSAAYDYNELRHLFGATVPPRELSEEGLLVRLGLFDRDQCGNVCISGLTETLLATRRATQTQMRDLLLGKRVPAILAWDDFAHLGTARDLAARLAASGATAGIGAANILLYGAPGTGKSEFVKTLGAHLGCPVYFVGEDNGRGTEPKRQERIAALTIANAIGATAENMIVAVDEADDLFAGVDEDNASTRQGSKVFMHRIVERVRAPTIWIVNDVDRLGPAVVRRMNLVVRFPQPTEAVRRKIVERIARREKVRLEASAVARLASLPAAPALIENAIRSAARIRGGGEEALEILGGSLRAMGQCEIAPASSPIGFDVSLSRADVDLPDLTARIRNAPSKALSFCLSGPPGTGKSAYARHLAAELGLEAIEKRYSDLISKYVGDSEKAIAAAFQEAADARAFLILDEADSLLRDRALAHHSWEITQVNEMLTWMERHPLPFACTTNAVDLLDPATARRFLFKVRFLPMDAGQVAAAFRKSFKATAPASLLQLETLTPGDFAVVARKAEALGETAPRRLAQWLEDEAAAKPDGRTIKMGF